MSRFRILLATAALVGAGSAAHAATVSYSTFTPTPTGTFEAVNYENAIFLTKFDSTLGTLTGVSITLDGFVSGMAKVENTAPASASSITSTLSASVILLNTARTTIASVAPSASFTDSATQFDGTIDFAGTSGFSHNVTSTTLSQTVTPSDLATYQVAGGGSLILLVDGVGASSATGGGNVIQQFITNARAVVTVTYTYNIPTPPAVPEPASMALLGAGLLGLGMVRRFKKN